MVPASVHSCLQSERSTWRANLQTQSVRVDVSTSPPDGINRPLRRPQHGWSWRFMGVVCGVAIIFVIVQRMVRVRFLTDRTVHADARKFHRTRSTSFTNEDCRQFLFAEANPTYLPTESAAILRPVETCSGLLRRGEQPMFVRCARRTLHGSSTVAPETDQARQVRLPSRR